MALAGSSKTRRRRRPATKHTALLRANRSRYEEILEQQGGVCALCKRPPKNRRLDMDHDHHRMVIRGLLCVRCNRALPAWMTSNWLRMAAYYIDQEV